MKQDYDNPEKEAVAEHFRLFAGLLLDWVACEVDWENAPVSLEQELRKAHPEAATGKRLVDCLFRLFKKGGDMRYLHLEAQAQFEDYLAHRVWEYNKKLTDHLGEEVVSIVLLLDEFTDWRPNCYEYKEWGCEKTFKYPVVKLLDWQGREEELASHSNVFALFVLGHLWSQQTAKNMDRRLELKLRLISLLMERKLDEAEFGSWRRLIDWQLQLPPEGEERVMEWLREKRREGVMPFVSVFEKVAREEGLKEGRDEGLKEGHKEGLHFAAQAILRDKFDAAGAALGPRLAKADAATLQAVITSALAGGAVEEIGRLLPPS